MNLERFRDLDNNITNNTDLYRVMTIDSLFTMLDNNTLQFKRPELWDDPFENFISRYNFGLNEYGNDIIFDIDMIYAQCWTKNCECDGMWRSFAEIDDGVMIKTTSNKIRTILSINYRNNFYIKDITYIEKNDLLNLIENEEFPSIIMENNNMHNLVNLFTLKRKEFEYEKEVRIIIQKFQNTTSILTPRINSLNFITEIKFAPETPFERYLYYKYLLESYGFPSEMIKKSDLYEFNEE